MTTVSVLHDDRDMRARLRLGGFEGLGDAELLAMVLGPGGPPAARLATEVLDEAGGLRGLARGGPGGGLSETRRKRLEAALELGRRVAVRGSDGPEVSFASPDRVGAWGRAQLGSLAHEELWLLALDGRHGLIAARRLAQGGAHGCATSSRDVLRLALRFGASGFVLVHNHPSGDPTPSAEDARMTVEVARAADVLGVPLLDHVVVGGGQQASLFELGLLERRA